MNNLSWFIYLTQIVDNLGNAAGIILAVGAFAGILGGLLGPMVVDVMDNPPSDRTIKTIIRAYFVTMGVACVVAVFSPSRQTMIMIAGSELGERAVKSDGVNSIVNPGLDLIRKWIKQEADKIKDKS